MTFPVAFAIGFSVASMPGPTILLIATETLRKGARAGLITMLAPLLLDALLMIPLGLVLQSALFSTKGAVLLGLLGASFLILLGLQSIRASIKRFRVRRSEFRELESRNSKVEIPANSDRELPSFVKGLLAHVTSPYPYLYWATAGSAFIRQGFSNGGFLGAALFPLGFWLGACTFTLLAIYIVARSKRLLPPRFEPHLHAVSGTLLIGGGIYLAARVWQGSFN